MKYIIRDAIDSRNTNTTYIYMEKYEKKYVIRMHYIGIIGMWCILYKKRNSLKYGMKRKERETDTQRQILKEREREQRKR